MHVQVARTDIGGSPYGPYGQFQLISLSGQRERTPHWQSSSNVYYSAVKPNPFDTRGGTLLGLFPVQVAM